MSSFLRLLAESVIVQGTLSIIVIGAAAYQWCNGHPLDPTHSAVLWALVGIWLGAKSENVKFRTVIDHDKKEQIKKELTQ